MSSTKMVCKLFAVVLAVAVCAGIALGQPQRCFASPSSWSGVFFRVDYSRGQSDRGYIFYNRTENRLMYSFESRIGTPDIDRHWLFYNTRKSYFYDENANTCEVEDIPSDEFIPLFGSLRGSEYIHHDRLGAYLFNLGVTADYFRLRTDTGGTYRGYYSPLYNSVATDFMCVPVIESYENIDTIPTHQRNIHSTYMNITTDPIPPIIWELPTACRERN